MQQVDSPALLRVSKALGLSTPGAQLTDFDDAVLQQVLDVAPIVRRSRALGSASGIFALTVENVHAAAGQVTATFDPYNLTSPRAGYPSPVPDGFDVWLIDAFCSAAIGVQSATAATRVIIRYGASLVALGAVGTVSQPWRLFLTEVAVSATNANLNLAPFGYAYGPTRVPRGADIQLISNAGAIGSIFGQFVIGLFPEGLGQDVSTG